VLGRRGLAVEGVAEGLAFDSGGRGSLAGEVATGVGVRVAAGATASLHLAAGRGSWGRRRCRRRRARPRFSRSAGLGSRPYRDAGVVGLAGASSRGIPRAP